jgi:hypothetical protein
VIPLDGDPACPARDTAGVRCRRWAQPAAHLDDHHENANGRWPVTAAVEQLALDLGLAS